MGKGIVHLTDSSTTIQLKHSYCEENLLKSETCDVFVSTTFGNIVPKKGIAHGEKFLLLPRCVQLYSIALFIYRRFPCFSERFSKSSAATFVYVVKG